MRQVGGSPRRLPRLGQDSQHQLTFPPDRQPPIPTQITLTSGGGYVLVPGHRGGPCQVPGGQRGREPARSVLCLPPSSQGWGCLRTPGRDPKLEAVTSSTLAPGGTIRLPGAKPTLPWTSQSPRPQPWPAALGPPSFPSALLSPHSPHSGHKDLLLPGSLPRGCSCGHHPPLVSQGVLTNSSAPETFHSVVDCIFQKWPHVLFCPLNCG